MLSISDVIKKILTEGTSYSKSMTARQILRAAQLQGIGVVLFGGYLKEENWKEPLRK